MYLYLWYIAFYLGGDSNKSKVHEYPSLHSHEQAAHMHTLEALSFNFSVKAVNM